LLRAISRLIRCLKRRKNESYLPLRFRQPGTPDENTERLKEAVARHFEHARNRTDEQNLIVGRFFGTILLVERKLVQLLERFDPEVEGRTFGEKLRVFKDFLNELDNHYEIDGIDREKYRNLLGPLREIKGIRDSMAHTLAKTTFSFKEIRQTSAYTKRKRPDLVEAAMSFPNEADRCVALVAAFGFVFSVEIGFLDHLFE
jgi:hypothetical protein